MLHNHLNILSSFNFCESLKRIKFKLIEIQVSWNEAAASKFIQELLPGTRQIFSVTLKLHKSRQALEDVECWQLRKVSILLLLQNVKRSLGFSVPWLHGPVPQNFADP